VGVKLTVEDLDKSQKKKKVSSDRVSVLFSPQKIEDKHHRIQIFVLE
jgi:hypothetical protein